MPKSLRILGAGKIGIQEGKKPQPNDHQILIKVVACGQNPLDVGVVGITANISEFADFYTGNTIGCDFAGIVESTGSLTTRFQPGDRVAGFVPGNLQDQGAFAEFLVTEEAFSARIPDDVSFEQAATIGVAASTAAISLYSHLNLPRRRKDPNPFKEFILVNGGSSAMGTMVIQIAKMSGAKVIALASSKNFGLVQSYGADKVFDYVGNQFCNIQTAFTN
uniref:Enoyl reductase (ER) domain-containing protein n=1 Tax=Bionectria ochroleuca TaxID=29856 RepID=A0A8H7N301_BIOOC